MRNKRCVRSRRRQSIDKYGRHRGVFPAGFSRIQAGANDSSRQFYIQPFDRSDVLLVHISRTCKYRLLPYIHTCVRACVRAYACAYYRLVSQDRGIGSRRVHNIRRKCVSGGKYTGEERKRYCTARRSREEKRKMSKTCARCEKTVYPIEELKCLDKVRKLRS